MTTTTKLTTFTLVVLSILSGCQRRYAHLTLTQGTKGSKEKTTRFNGHYVEVKNQESEHPKKSDYSEIPTKSELLSEHLDKSVKLLPTSFGTPLAGLRANQEIKRDTISRKPQKVMYNAKGPETALFFGLLGANIGYFMLPQFTELFAVVLISVLALAVIYLATMLFRNMADTRIRPYRTKKRTVYAGRTFDTEKVKKGFGIFMLVGLAAALVSIPLFAVDFWGLAIFLSLLGFVCICAGVILGLTYLILSV